MFIAKGYRVVDIPLGIGFVIHSFYLKEHSEKKAPDNDGTDSGFVLFVGNCDYGKRPRSLKDIDAYLRQIFGIFGQIENISVSDLKNSSSSDNSRFAHVTFKSRAALKAALKAPDEMYFENAKEVAKIWGAGDCLRKRSRQELLTQIRSQYQYPDIDEFKEEVYTNLKEFEENEEAAKREKERRLNEVDEDGFIPVKNRKKVKLNDTAKRGTGQKRSRSDGKKAKKSTELKNFYRFQMKAEKKERLVELRRKFEEDKQRVANMKANRKFNPFGSLV